MLKILKKNKTLTLLFSLLVLIVVLPYFETPLGSVLFIMLLSIVLVSGLYAVSYNIRYVAAGLLLVVPTLITVWSNITARKRMESAG